MKYSEIEIGQTAELKHVITRSDILNFIDLTDDNNIVHSGDNPIAHGMLVASFVSTLIGTQLPGHGSIWMSHDITFLKPVRENDEIIINAVIKEKHDAWHSVRMSVDIHNQKGEFVMASTCWIKPPQNGTR